MKRASVAGFAAGAAMMIGEALVTISHSDAKAAPEIIPRS